MNLILLAARNMRTMCHVLATHPTGIQEAHRGRSLASPWHPERPWIASKDWPYSLSTISNEPDAAGISFVLRSRAEYLSASIKAPIYAYLSHNRKRHDE